MDSPANARTTSLAVESTAPRRGSNSIESNGSSSPRHDSLVAESGPTGNRRTSMNTESGDNSNRGRSNSSVPNQISLSAYLKKARGDLILYNRIECPSEVMSGKFSDDGQWAAVGLMDSTIKIFNPSTGACAYVLTDEDALKAKQACTSLHWRHSTWSSDHEQGNIIVAGYGSGLLKFWHYPTKRCLSTIVDNEQVLCLDFNCTGNLIHVGGASSCINIYDFETRKKIRSCTASEGRGVMDGHRSRIFSVKTHPFDPNIFITGGWDDTVQVWDNRVDHSVRKMFGPHVCGDALDIEPSTENIVAGSWGRQPALEVWDFKSGKRLLEFPQKTVSYSVYACLWTDDYIVAGGSEPHMLQFISRRSLNEIGCLQDLKSGVYCVDHAKSRNLTLAGSANELYIVTTGRT